MNEEYIEEQYSLAVLDFKLAKTENEQWDARKQMAKLEELMVLIYGDAFRLQMREKYKIK